MTLTQKTVSMMGGLLLIMLSLSSCLDNSDLQAVEEFRERHELTGIPYVAVGFSSQRTGGALIGMCIEVFNLHPTKTLTGLSFSVEGYDQVITLNAASTPALKPVSPAFFTMDIVQKLTKGNMRANLKTMIMQKEHPRLNAGWAHHYFDPAIASEAQYVKLLRSIPSFSVEEEGLTSEVWTSIAMPDSPAKVIIDMDSLVWTS